MKRSFPGRIVEINRLRNSVNGNPRFAMTLEVRHLGTFEQTWNTAADHAFNYEIGNAGCREGSWVRVTIGGRGTIVDIETAGAGAAFGDAMARWGKES
jgi:hypothetical protein